MKPSRRFADGRYDLVIGMVKRWPYERFSCLPCSLEGRSFREILGLYAQTDLDDGKVFLPSEADRIFERMARYPDYTIYVAVCNDQIVGTFALLIIDNLGHGERHRLSSMTWRSIQRGRDVALGTG